MRTRHSHPTPAKWGIALALGCALTVLGATGALAASEMATWGSAYDRPSINLTPEDIRDFERRAHRTAALVDDDAEFRLSAVEIYFLEQNLFLPDGGAADRTPVVGAPLLPPAADDVQQVRDGQWVY